MPFFETLIPRIGFKAGIAVGQRAGKIKEKETLGGDLLRKPEKPFKLPRFAPAILAATLASPIPGDELVAGAIILGGAAVTGLFIKNKGPEAFRQLVQETIRATPKVLQRVKETSGDIKKAIFSNIQKIVPVNIPDFPRGIPAKPEEVEPFTFPAIREELKVRGFEVPPIRGFRVPEGITTTPPFVPPPTEIEVKGKEALIPTPFIPPTVTEMRLLKAIKPSLVSKVKRGRFALLEGEISSISKQLSTLEKTRDTLAKKGLPTKAIDTQLQALWQRFNFADSQIAELITSDIPLEELQKQKATIKIRDVLRVEERALTRVERVERTIQDIRTRSKERIIQRQFRGRVNKMLLDIKRVDVKRLRPEFAAKGIPGFLGDVKGIKEVLDFAVPSKKTVAKLTAVKEFIAQNPEITFSNQLTEQLARLDKINKNTITLEQLETIHTAVLGATHFSRIKNKLLGRQKGRAINEVVTKSENNINKHKKIKPNEKYDIDFSQKNAATSSLKQVYVLGHWDPETITNILDDNAEGDVISKVLYGDIDKGVTEAFRYRQNIDRKQSDWFAENNININDWSAWFEKDKSRVDWQDIKLPSGKTIRMSKGNRIEFYMNTLNAKNAAHLENGFSLAQNPTQIFKLSQEDIQAIANSITDEEIRVAAQVMKDIVWDPQHIAINKPFVEINGYDLGKEVDYIPINVAGVTLSREEKGLFKRLSKMALEESGFLKERLDAKNPIIIGDVFKTAYDSIGSAATFIGLAVPIRNARLVMFDERFESTLTQVFGRAWFKNLETYLEDVVGGTANLDDIEKIIATVKDRLVGAKILANPFVWLYQPVSYMAASTEIDPKWLIKNVNTMATKELIDKWTSRSPQLMERIRVGFARDVADIGRIGAVRKFWTGRTGFINKLGAGIKNFDTKTVIRIAESAEDEQEALGFKGEELARRATERAEFIIRRTQPTFHPKDRNALSRTKNPLLKFITIFMSQRFKNVNIQRRAFLRYGTSPKSPRDKAKLIWALLLTSIIQHQLIRGLKRLRRIILKKPKPKKKDKPTTIFVREILGGVLGNFAGGATFAQSLASKIQNGTFAGYDMDSVLASTLETGVNAIAEFWRGLEQFFTEERFKSGDKKFQLKWKTSLLRAADKGAQTILELKAGFPYMPVKEAILGAGRWIIDIKTEKLQQFPKLKPSRFPQLKATKKAERFPRLRPTR